MDWHNALKDDKKGWRVAIRLQHIVSGLWIWFAIQALFWLQSAVLYIFEQNEKWFSRAMASIFCQAIAAILYKMKSR